MSRWITTMTTVLLLALSACDRSPSKAPVSTPPPSNADPQLFQVAGVVKSVNPSEKQIEIKHDAIPGYMPAMTMPFDVKDTNELAGVAPGDAVTFRLLVGKTEGWIDTIRKIRRPSTNGPPPNSGMTRVGNVPKLELGESLPEYQLTNELGQTTTTTHYKGQALAISFLFTRCPYPTFCPRLAQNLAETQHALLSSANSPTNWHLLTISFDPEFDTPAVLKAYAQAWHYDPRHWTFATGAAGTVATLAGQFGVYFWRDETGSISHNMRTAVFTPSGKLAAVLEGNQWTSDDLVKALRNALNEPASEKREGG